MNAIATSVLKRSASRNRCGRILLNRSKDKKKKIANIEMQNISTTDTSRIKVEIDLKDIITFYYLFIISSLLRQI